MQSCWWAAVEEPASPFPCRDRVLGLDPGSVHRRWKERLLCLCQPDAGLFGKGAQVPFPLLETIKIIPLLLTRYMLHTVDIVMPLSAKPTAQCAFLTLIIRTISLYRDTYSQACRKLCCVAVQYPSQPPCSACFAHFSTAVSSPAQKALKGAFRSSNTSHLAVFNINPFFLHAFSWHWQIWKSPEEGMFHGGFLASHPVKWNCSPYTTLGQLLKSTEGRRHAARG